MEVVYWEGGLLRHEVAAIDTMSRSFPHEAKPSPVPGKGTNQGKSLAAQLQPLKHSAIPSNGMWPWKGYAGFRFVDARGKEGEFDLVIVTHKIILIVELKHWHGKITSHGGKWFQNGDERDNSPVAVTQKKVWLLQNKLKAIQHQLPGNRLPAIKFCVVLTGECSFDELPDTDREHVLLLKDFLKIEEERNFNNRFRPHPDAAGLNQYFEVFDGWLKQGSIKPKDLVVEGFRAGEKIFAHPGNVYVEYEAANENNKSERALLRLWDFNQLKDIDAKTPEGRFKILSRERDVLVYLGQHDLELARRCLRPFKNPSRESITQEYSELCDLPAGHVRFNEFINRFAQQLSEEDRIKRAKMLVAQFAKMHGFKVAHRDLGDHSVWLSPSSAMALSNFIAAYHQPAGTVGPRRDQLSIGAISLPEDKNKGSHRGTPFHRDVFALGILSWHLIKATPLPLTLDESYIASVLTEMKSAGTWFAGILATALADNPDARYPDAGELLDELNKSTPRNPDVYEFDSVQLEPFSNPRFNAYKAYASDEDILDEEDKEIYRSGNYIVKLWPSIHADSPQGGQGPMLLSFFKKLEALKKSNYDFLPTIELFGYGKSGAPFVVQHHVSGCLWSAIEPDDDFPVQDVINMLIDAIECLHEQQLSHGDLHPGNVIVDIQGEGKPLQVYLLDMPDLSVSGTQPFNNRYSPVIENCTTFERDNFAVMRMATELLRMNWDHPSDGDIPEIRCAIEHELGSNSGFIALERFRDALTSAFKPIDHQDRISITVWGYDENDFSIYPDNGELFLHIKPDAKNKGNAEITFSGIGGRFIASYNPLSKYFERASKAQVKDYVHYTEQESADLAINLRIDVAVRKNSQLRELSSYMEERLQVFHDLVCNALSDALAPISEQESESDKPKHSTPSIKIDLDDTNELRHPESVHEIKVKNFSAGRIWRAIMETEEEALPSIEVTEDPFLSKDKQGLMIPFTSAREVLESFESDDKVRLIKKNDSKTFDLGEIDVRRSTKAAIYLNLSFKKQNILPEDRLYLQTTLSRSSLTRRKKALDRILDRQSVIPNLVSYFDEDCEHDPIDYEEQPSSSHFSVYERETSDGRIVGLNDAQKAAFSRLVRFGPLGLLQGPPGTGKTEFIAAFCHYLVSQIGVRNILLVSQSHEAVNTAAERIRAHCRRLDTEIDVVRFSNREHVVSDELKDIFSRSIVTQQQQSFMAEMKFRLAMLAPSLGVSRPFIENLIGVQVRVLGLVRSIERLQDDLEKAEEDKDEAKDLKGSLKGLDNELNTMLREDFGIQPDTNRNHRAWLEQVYISVANKHGVRSHELKRCLSLIELSDELIDRISSDRANYDEFLMRSRTLVCGTCVGIGLGHLKLADNRFDWIIIDEAARSSPSELAIAMQVGSRVLLVGDHRQLPPTYEEEHKKAIARDLEVHHNSAELQHAMRSDFERAFESNYGQLVSATLKTQYRMQPSIGNLVSDVFYDGLLETGSRPVPAHFNQPPSSLLAVVTWLDTGVLGKKAHHADPQGTSSLLNHQEADAIVRLLKSIEENMAFSTALVDEMSKTQEPAIGVICMYAEQKRLIQRKFAGKNWSEEFKRLVKIDTVDSYQGKENRIVIVSLTRSNEELSPGFLRLPNRVNVAMSRAMDRLIIVGDIRMWAGRNAELPLGRVASYIRSRQHDKEYAIKPVDSLGGQA